MTKTAKEQILELKAENPDWGSVKLSQAVGCNPRHAARVLAKSAAVGPDDAPEPESGIRPCWYSVAVLTDIHSPYQDKEALGIALDHCASKEPDCVVFNGDFADFYKISSWGADPRLMSFADEVEADRKLIAEIAGMFPKARKVFIAGNHEYRLHRFLCKGDPAQLMGLKEMQVPHLLHLYKHGFEYHDNIELLERGEPAFSIGKLHFLHGHEIKVTHTAVNAPRLYYQKAKVQCITGHNHKTDQWIGRKLSRETVGAWSVGGLCNLNPSYSPHNDWNHGFALVYFDEDGNHEVKNRMIVNGKVL